MNLDKQPAESVRNSHPDSQPYHTVPCKTISWEDLHRSATVLTEFSQEAKKEIEYYLGYLPDESITIRFEPFLRSLIQQKNAGLLPYEQYSKLAEQHVRLIRNEDVRYNLVDDYDQQLYQTYFREYLPYGALAKQRLIDMMGYAPELKHSLLAELYLRKILANELIRLPLEMTPVDYRAMTLIRYRQILLSRGKDAADNWPVLNCEPDSEFSR
ncbi:hypothetical protein DYBT9275_04886 [Dyadobacter sp. CECT 9275]|uniref:Uncharacterized protein n=1 Tax=Dyadobacter helix TaxID=2822344 RepID=A0A916JGA4_9BACT|nr:hypothetical protein [Dyadobacter sp. CECT 9275]CAG5011125.1 hypothetical protein DYBT9275_04886 [Dyadobacter sp. CECT 9275]